MIRLLIFLVGMLSTSGGRGLRPSARHFADPGEPEPRSAGPDGTWVIPEPDPPAGTWPHEDWPDQAWPRQDWPRQDWPRQDWPAAPAPSRRRPRRRRRIPLKVRWAAILLVAALIFRKAIAWAALAALSATFHLVGVNVHLPHVSLAWPWQSISAGTTTNVPLGPWVLQKIEGISRPALGTENFNFSFTRKVSKNIGIWPCWYSSTFNTVGHASATVDLNPGPSWWQPSTGHYRLQMLNPPGGGAPGRVSVALTLPRPQLPQSVHDVTVDNTMSQPIDVQHSWTYPGLGCGALIRPQFSVSVLYAQAQSIAFAQVKNNPRITGPLISTAEAQAEQIIRNNFIQPTVNALGYTLAGFSIRWTGTG
ncbi:MAG: hypothetical protein WAK82_00195 [Streptosporangiaceae bacterium]